MDDYITIFQEAVYDAIAVYVNPRDYNERIIPGLGDAILRADNVATLMSGCVGRYGPVRIYTDPGVPLGTVRRSVGF